MKIEFQQFKELTKEETVKVVGGKVPPVLFPFPDGCGACCSGVADDFDVFIKSL